jgi:hypothetical protein
MVYTQAVTVCLLAISFSKANGQESARLRDIDMRHLMSRKRTDVPPLSNTRTKKELFRHEPDVAELNIVDEADAAAEGRHNKQTTDVPDAVLKVLIGDGAESRHGLGIDELNQKNPEGCTVDVDGNFLFSDFASATEIDLGFVYEIVTRGASPQQLEVDILPMLERKLSNTVLAGTFVNSCLGVRLRRFLESRKLEVVGLRTAPPDAVLDGGKSPVSRQYFNGDGRIRTCMLHF